jgi:predicted anti-sigma-YlaC factor YlaD
MTVMTNMTLDRFARIVEAYGAEPRAWPEAERDAALAFHAHNGEARKLCDEAAALDAMLAQSQAPQADRALEDRIMADFRNRGRKPAHQQRWLGAGALAASLVIGVTAGWIVLRPHSGVDLSDPTAWEVLGDDLEFAAKDKN